MHDFAVQPPNCVEGPDCGSPPLAITLFLIFYVVCTYIFVNLFTVVSEEVKTMCLPDSDNWDRL